MSTTVRDSGKLIAKLERFYTPNFRAEWETESISQTEIFVAYVVRSYGVEIARLTSNREAIINPKKYSQTTSRHLNIVKRAWELN